MSSARLVLAFVGGIAVSIGAIYFALAHRPLTRESFELLTASPASVSVATSNKQPFVEIRLPDDPLRYRIAVERFKDFDDPNGFLHAASRPGAVLRMHVKRGARRHPDRPRIDPQPTVFVEAVAVDGRDFYPLTRRIEWDEKNVLYARIIAVLFPLLTSYLGLSLWRSRAKPDSAA